MPVMETGGKKLGMHMLCCVDHGMLRASVDMLWKPLPFPHLFLTPPFVVQPWRSLTVRLLPGLCLLYTYLFFTTMFNRYFCNFLGLDIKLMTTFTQTCTEHPEFILKHLMEHYRLLLSEKTKAAGCMGFVHTVSSDHSWWVTYRWQTHGVHTPTRDTESTFPATHDSVADVLRETAPAVQEQASRDQSCWIARLQGQTWRSSTKHNSKSKQAHFI